MILKGFIRKIGYDIVYLRFYIKVIPESTGLPDDTGIYWNLQSAVDFVSVEGGFDVEDYVAGVEDGGDVEAFEFLVGYGGDAGVELVAGGEFVGHAEAVFALYGGGVGPGVVDGYVEVVFLEGFDDVDDFGVAYIGAVFLEGEAQDEDMTAEHLDAFLEHELDDAVGHVGAHAVVHASAGEDDFGVVAVALGALGQVVGVDADAVSADESGLEGQEVPLGGCGFEDVGGVDAHQGEDFRQFVDEGDVDVALRVFDYLGGFGYLDGGRQVGAGGYHAAVDFIYELADFRSRAGGDFPDMLYGVLLVAGIDALGRVAGVEILVHLQAADFLYHGDALVLSHAGIDGRLVDHDIVLADYLADGLGRSVERGEVGVVVLVDGGGHGHDVEVAVADVVEVGGAAESVVIDGVLEQLVADLEGGVVAGHERFDAARVHVEAYGRILGREQASQRQTYVAESDNTDFDIFLHRLYVFVYQRLCQYQSTAKRRPSAMEYSGA